MQQNAGNFKAPRQRTAYHRDYWYWRYYSDPAFRARHRAKARAAYAKRKAVTP